ncbi:hAT family dimerization domain protein [Fusarium beomiforme]|uniref:HAT family dimerization domain protein n=1 Tax=Fusarium beomiforme TaxID=44412 RepID=A0A9P5A7E9_9HYPO|nr:hAT family dimerization domain protein [Fusarium beomiforme]
MLLTDGIDLIVWPEPTRRPCAPEEVVDSPPHCRLSRCRLLFANIYRPLGELGSSCAPATSVQRCPQFKYQVKYYKSKLLLGISGQRKSLKQQLDATSIKTEAGRTTLADLLTVQIGCRRSWIQAHGFFLTEVSPDLRTLQTYWVCSKCDERGKSSLFVATNTTSPIEHLRRSHMITEADDNADEDSYSSLADIHPSSKRRCLESPTARSNVTKAKELTVGWIVTANLPFTAPSNP